MDFGEPERIWHDLSRVIAEACPAALPQVAHDVCHAHLATDVGEDLYRAPPAALSKDMQSLKLPGQLKEQRRGQHERLQAQVRQATVARCSKPCGRGYG